MTTPKIFTAIDITEAMRQVINNHPEGDSFVYSKDLYQSCYYFKDGKPDCIVGHVLQRLVPNFTPKEGVGISGQVASLKDLGFAPLGIAALQVAQRVQDTGGTWGAAFQAAYAVTHLIYSMPELINNAP